MSLPINAARADARLTIRVPVPLVARVERIGADFVFVGGETRWKRAYGAEIVGHAHGRDIAVHIGRPDGEDGLPWAYKIGADSADTSTIDQNGYWHYLERLEDVTQGHSKGASLKKDTRQSQLVSDGGRCNDCTVSPGTDRPEGGDGR